jgi:hypothetical protein
LVVASDWEKGKLSYDEYLRRCEQEAQNIVTSGRATAATSSHPQMTAEELQRLMEEFRKLSARVNPTAQWNPTSSRARQYPFRDPDPDKAYSRSANGLRLDPDAFTVRKNRNQQMTNPNQIETEFKKDLLMPPAFMDSSGAIPVSSVRICWVNEKTQTYPVTSFLRGRFQVLKPRKADRVWYFNPGEVSMVNLMLPAKSKLCGFIKFKEAILHDGNRFYGFVVDWNDVLHDRR